MRPRSKAAFLRDSVAATVLEVLARSCRGAQPATSPQGSVTVAACTEFVKVFETSGC